MTVRELIIQLLRAKDLNVRVVVIGKNVYHIPVTGIGKNDNGEIEIYFAQEESEPL